MTISRPKALLNTQPSNKNKTATSERKQNPYFFFIRNEEKYINRRKYTGERKDTKEREETKGRMRGPSYTN